MLAYKSRLVDCRYLFWSKVCVEIAISGTNGYLKDVRDDKCPVLNELKYGTFSSHLLIGNTNFLYQELLLPDRLRLNLKSKGDVRSTSLILVNVIRHGLCYIVRTGSGSDIALVFYWH